MFRIYNVKKSLLLILLSLFSYEVFSAQNPFVKPEKKEEQGYQREQQRNIEVKDINLNSLEKNIIKPEEPVEIEIFRINGSVVYKNKQNSTYRIN